MKKEPDKQVEEQFQQKVYTIANRIRRWKHHQSQLMPLFVGNDLGDDWTEDLTSGSEAYSAEEYSLHTTLGLPSDLDVHTRESVCSEALVKAEIALRRAEASEAIEDVRSCVRALATLGHDRAVHVRGQSMNTRANRFREVLEEKKVYHMEIYNQARNALLSLRIINDEATRRFYPVLTNEDTYRRDPSHRREPGDSKRNDGRLWHPLEPPQAPTVDASTRLAALPASTSGTRRSTSKYLNLGQRAWYPKLTFLFCRTERRSSHTEYSGGFLHAHSFVSLRRCGNF